MRFLFNLDSPFMQIVNRLCDLVILNVIYLLTCLPLFTIGAATAALYATVFPMDTEREGKLLATYFRAFRENFKQGTAVFALIALLAFATYYNMVHFVAASQMVLYAFGVVSMAVAVLLCFLWAWVFPLISRFQNKTLPMVKNALLLSIGNLPRTLVAAAINVFPWVLMVVNLYAFIKLSFLWFILYFAAAAYFNSRVLKKVFDNLAQKKSDA